MTGPGTSPPVRENFANAGKVSITSANDQDEATFAEQTPTTIVTVAMELSFSGHRTMR